MTPPIPPAELLLAHAGWVRALARELTRDAVEAEELAQDALSAALASPGAPREPRAWLAGLVRHRASRARRGSARRAERECAAARPEAQPSAAELVARVDAHRALVDELRALDEPWRETLLLRWFEELPPRAIAARQGVPVATVHARLARGHELLRVRLDRRAGGDRGVWLPAIAALAAPARPPAGGAVLLGALSMTKVAIGAGCAVVLAMLWLALGSGEPAAPRAAKEVARAGPVLASDSDPAEISQPEAPARVSADSGASQLPEAGTDAADPRRIETATGQVLDARGRPLAGVEVLARPALPGLDARLLSDAQGRFELPLPPPYRMHTVSARLPGHVVVLVGELEAASRELHVVLAPAISLSGVVVDERDAPVAGVTVSLTLGEGFGSELAVPLDHSREQEWSARSDERGRFAFETAPGVSGAQLELEGSAELDSHPVPAPAITTDDLRLVLRLRQVEETLRGRVLDVDGLPRPGAWVAAGDAGARSDEAGAFALDLRRVGDATRLLAAVEGQLPAVVEALPGATGAERWPAPLELRLGGAPLEIAGRLLDEEGEPIPQRGVYLCDPTSFGPTGRWGGLTAVESLLSGRGGDPYCLTDDEGRFRMTGLLAREYTLQATDPATLRVARSGPLPAGSEGVELRFSDVAAPVTLAGRCVDAAGEPVARLEVRASRLVRSWAGSRSRISGAPALTDADGRFRIEALPPEVDQLGYDAEHVLPGALVLEGAGPLDALVLVVPRRCHLQVEASPRYPEAAGFEVLDPDGRPLELVEFRGRSRSGTHFALLREGRSSVLAVSDAAATIVLRAGGEEFARREVALDPGETTLVRFD